MLNRLAVRICAVYALMGNTFAEDCVKDSAIMAIDPESMTDETSPFIAVYTDDQFGNDLTLNIEIGVTARMAVKDDFGKDIIVSGIPPTDAGIEMVVDSIERQLTTAFSDENNEWAELLGLVFAKNKKNKSVRGSSKSSSGERYAGRQILFEGQVLADPEFGRALDEGGFWFKFLQKVEAEPNLQSMATTIRALLGAEVGGADWILVKRALGITLPEAQAMGIAPAQGDEIATILGSEIETNASAGGS